MTKHEALNGLYITYHSGYGASKQDITRLFDNAFREFKTVEKAYNISRFYLSIMYGESEKFTVSEVARLLDVSEVECMQMIQRAGIKVLNNGL